MRRVVFALAVVMLLAAAIPACAVDLQAGWYVKFEDVRFVGRDSLYNEWQEAWLPTSQLGQFGPLLIEAGTNGFPRGRTVTITENTSVGSGVIYEDAGLSAAPFSHPYYQELNVVWETNYDATKLQLQVFRQRDGYADELVWRQTQSEYANGFGNIWYSSPIQPGDKIVFRLVAVPEPSGLAGIAGGVITCILQFFRRKRQ